jgi:uncharacterized membrane protein (Fun14 family)
VKYYSQSIIPFAGSGLVGYAIGFALKKILKLMLIIIGFLALLSFRTLGDHLLVTNLVGVLLEDSSSFSFS